MRWKFGLLFLTLAVLFWVLCSLPVPYTTMGVGPQYLRPLVAVFIADTAIIALILLGVATLIVFWERENRGGKKAIAFVIAVLFFGGTAAARLVYILFYVLENPGDMGPNSLFLYWAY